MESATDKRPARRTYAASGVIVLGASDPDPGAPVNVRARIVRDGQIYPVDPPGAPSPLRMAVNAAALFILMLGVGLASIALVPVALGYRLVVVSSGSMEPSLSVADVVIAADPAEETVVVGTVIDIETENGGLIHRVVEVVPGGFRTKGDANLTTDSGIIAPESINGIGVFLVPFVGLPRIWFDNGEWVRLGALMVLLVTVAYTSRSDWLRRARRPKPSERRTHALDGVT